MLFTVAVVFASGFAGCRAAVEPNVIVPRVFETEAFTAKISTYPGEVPGDLKPIFAVLYDGWRPCCAKGKFTFIGTPEKPVWELKIERSAKTGYAIMPEYFYYRNSQGKIEKYPAHKECAPYAYCQFWVPQFMMHTSQMQLYIVVEYTGKFFKIRVPINKKKIYIYTKPGYQNLWTAGSESISKTF